MDDAVSFHKVSKHFGHFSLAEVSLKIPKGYITGIIGPNGSGKTTLIKLIMNLLHPENGEVRIFDKPYLGNEKEIKSKIGFVYEDGDIFPRETVKRIKEMVAPLYPTWKEKVFERYRNRFRLSEKTRVGDLSKGMRMKLFLALALSHEAELIVMDEPTSGLDPIFRRELLEIFSELMQSENQTIIFSTHIVSDLERIADFITFIYDGKIVCHQPKDELLNTFSIVKGTNDSLNKEVEQHLIGIRRSEVGFEALTREVSEVQNLAGNHYMVIETPSLEDVMFYYNKGGKSWGI